MLYQCFQSLKVYGKEPEAFDAVCAMHMLVLGDYPMKQIREAFAKHLKNSNELPSPSDIANIIERGGKPPFEKAVYVSISKKMPEERSKSEWEYLQDYEYFQCTGDYA